MYLLKQRLKTPRDVGTHSFLNWLSNEKKTQFNSDLSSNQRIIPDCCNHNPFGISSFAAESTNLDLSFLYVTALIELLWSRARTG